MLTADNRYCIIIFHFHSFQQSDSIVPVSIVEKGFRARTLHSGDIDSAGGSIASDQDGSESHAIYLTPTKSIKSNDNSLTYSEDSDTTRIYNLDRRETKIVKQDEARAESPIESPVKLGQQFFRVSPKKVPEIRKMDDEVTTVIRTSNRNYINGDEDGSVSWKGTQSKVELITFKLSLPGKRCARDLRGEASHRSGSDRQPSVG